MFLKGQPQSEKRLSNENEKVSFEKLFTSELEWNGERDKAADKTKSERNRNLRSKILNSQRWRKEEKQKTKAK